MKHLMCIYWINRKKNTIDNTSAKYICYAMQPLNTKVLVSC